MAMSRRAFITTAATAGVVLGVSEKNENTKPQPATPPAEPNSTTTTTTTTK